MNAYFFHTAAQPLFGIYAPPRTRIDRGEAVLLCPPIAHEYSRTHWAVRQLGDHLTGAGFHVFRFDYSGLGDSWGDFTQASVARWRADIEAALAELEENAGVRKISLLGVRLGATLAWDIARKRTVHRLVCWDPVVSGQAFVDDLRRMHGERKRTWPHAKELTPGAACEDLLGFRYPAALLQELATLDLLAPPLPRARECVVVSSANRPEDQTLVKHLSNGGAKATLAVCEDAGDWQQVDFFAEPLVLGPLQRTLAQCLIGGDA